MKKDIKKIANEALDEALSRKHQRSLKELEIELKEVNIKISEYPVPIPKCDEQFNALLEKREVLQKEIAKVLQTQKEFGGPEGPEPTRYGDWEKKGIVSDF